MKLGNPGVLVRPGPGDEDQVGCADPGKSLRQVPPVALLTGWSRPVRAAAGEHGVHAPRGRREAAPVLEVGVDDVGAERGQPGGLGAGRVPGGRAHRMPMREEQVNDSAEPPGRPGDQDPPGGGARYPVRIVRETHKGNLSGLRTISPRPPIAPLVMRLNAALTGALHERLPGAGFPDIRPPHCQVLRGIEPGGSRLTDLAAAAQMTKQSMGELVDHLEAAGYVERVPDREDARVKAIRLTPRGRHATRAIADIGTQIETEWASKIGRTRLEQLREALAAIIA